MALPRKSRSSRPGESNRSTTGAGCSMSSTTAFAHSASSKQWRGHFVSRNGKPLNRFTALADEMAR
jgi:hypothetical protein